MIQIETRESTAALRGAYLLHLRFSSLLVWVLGLLIASISTAGVANAKEKAEMIAKPKVAIFPLAGDTDEDLRAKCGFSLRTKLDREGTYEVLDGYTMAEIAEGAEAPVGLETPPELVRALADEVEATVIVWGELNNEDAGATMRLKVLDLREKDPQPREVTKVIAQPTDLRFVSEQILEILPGLKPFEHPSDVAVTNDATAEALWKKNPNLVSNFDFSDHGSWHALYMAEKYAVKISDELPAVDKVNIYRHPPEEAGGKPNNVLAMNLSRFCAE